MNDDLFDQLLDSVRQSGAIRRGENKPSRSFTVVVPDVRKIRESWNLSQSNFATILGISVGTLRNWEQGRRVPEGPARVLLQVALKHPDAVWDTVREFPKPTKKKSNPIGQ